MIDIENEMFTTISKSLKRVYPGIFVTGEKVAAPKQYPCVSIEEIDNYTYPQTEDSSNIENHAHLVYEIQVLSNKTNGKKSECKTIFSIIDDEFRKQGFIRKNRQPINMDDAKSYQLLGRYEAIVSKNKTIYRR